MTVFNHYIYTVLTLLLINNTISIYCSGEPATQFCVCYLTRYECKTAISEYERADCFYHNKHGCISITNAPSMAMAMTTNPTLNPTHNRATNIASISTLNCGDKIYGSTKSANDINWYSLNINALTDLLIDSCGSSYDTWLYLQHNTSIAHGADAHNGAIIDCDDCGYCSLQSQLQLSNINQGTYMVGIGGYRDDFGSYVVAITCTTSTTTISPTLYPTDIPTPNPTPKPTNSPIATNIVTIKPSTVPTKITRILTSIQPSYNPSASSSSSSTSTHNMEFFSNKRSKINGFEWALIFAVLLIILVIGCMFGVKCNTKRKHHHLNISVVENDCDEDEDDDDDIISYVHGKTNRVNIDEILERAKTDLMNLATDE